MERSVSSNGKVTRHDVPFSARIYFAYSTSPKPSAHTNNSLKRTDRGKKRNERNHNNPPPCELCDSDYARPISLLAVMRYVLPQFIIFFLLFSVVVALCESPSFELWAHGLEKKWEKTNTITQRPARSSMIISCRSTFAGFLLIATVGGLSQSRNLCSFRILLEDIFDPCDSRV